MPQAVVSQSIVIAAAPESVWAALVHRDNGRVWRGADFDTDWQVGAPIKITAQIGPKRYNDKGKVLQVEPPSLLAYEFLPRVSGLPDLPENYSVVTLRLTPSPAGTTLNVDHTVPPSPIRRGKNFEIGPESGEKHVQFYWRSTLPILRDLVEDRPSLALQMARASQAETS